MSDQEIIQKLIDHDNLLTKEFFFKHCKPLFCSIINKIFNYPVNYDEFINELYLHLMDNDAKRLRTFNFDSSLYGWLRSVAIHYFLDKKNHDKVIENESEESLSINNKNDMTSEPISEAKMDVERLLVTMPNQRYAYVIRKLVLEDMLPEDLADEMDITTANLYNIKKRAILQLTQVALIDIKIYKKQG